MQNIEDSDPQVLWTRFENHLLNSGISLKRRLKCKSMFALLCKYLGPNLLSVKRQDVESFVNNINRNNIISTKGRPYSGRTKQDIKKFIKQFWKWMLGNNEAYPLMVNWIKTRIPKDERPVEKDIISRRELHTLCNWYSKIDYKLLTLLLFDSGFRIQEMLSVRKKDITWEDYDDKGNKCFWIKCCISKTIPRKIPVPLFTEDLQTIFNTTWYQQLDPSDRVINMNYAAINANLRKSTIKVLGKKLTAHHFRHSSATYYAKAYDGNMNLIGERYGWTFDSKELSTYIRRSGVYQKQGAKKIYSNETTKLRTEVDALKTKLSALETIHKKQMLEMQDRLFKQITKFVKAKFNIRKHL